MIPESRYERVKLWAQRNQDKIFLGVVGTVVVALVVVGIKAEISFQEKMDAELNGYIDELNAMYKAAKEEIPA
jgi:hypothetical protein